VCASVECLVWYIELIEDLGGEGGDLVVIEVFKLLGNALMVG
jgi:hypothetical protein